MELKYILSKLSINELIQIKNDIDSLININNNRTVNKIDNWRLSLDNRLINTLEFYGLNTLEDITKKGKYEISKLRGIGKHALSQLDDIIESRKLSW